MKMGKEGLDKAYDDTVNRIENQQQGIRELAKNMLFWIAFAKRPLITEELRHALAVEPGTRSLDMRNLCPVEDMVSSCAGLVTINRESNTIGLVHYTTQEYFQRCHLEAFRDVNRDIISTSCLTCLSYDVFTKDYLPDSNLLSLQQNVFFRYAAENWGYHIQDTQQSVVDLALKFLMDDGKVSTSGQVLFQREYRPPQCCGIHLVAYFGLNDMMLRLVEEKDPDTKDSNGRTPLSYAAEKGNASMVKLLFNYNVDINHKCEKGWTPLSEAIEGGSAATVQLLLAQGAKIEFRYRLVSISNHI
jgi:ankyrin repeat protein/GPI inositol-deacylase-like protein